VNEPVPPFDHGRVCELPFATTVERLRAAIEANGLWVLHEIDPQAIVARAGHQIGLTRQILFFHPDFMVRLLAADPAALLEAPLKFAVMELDGAVSVRWLDPAIGFARYGNAALAEVGRELAVVCERIVDAALVPVLHN
jgi:uncharacterized protein (DUF302 family)